MPDIKEYQLGKIAGLRYGKMISRSDMTKSGYPVYSGYRITGYTNKYMLEEPAVIVVARGVGGTGDVKISPAKSWITNLSIILDINERIADKKYLQLYLHGDNLKHKLDTGAAQSQITISSLSVYPVNLPSIEYQKRVALIVQRYDDLIENNSKRIVKLEEMASLIYENTFSDRNAIQSTSTVGESFDILGGGTPSKKDLSLWKNGDINWFTPSDLTKSRSMFIEESSDKINGLGLSKSSAKLFSPKCIMMTSRATIGVISINTQPASTNQGFITCIPNNKTGLYYLYYWVKSVVPEIEMKASGSTFKEISKGVFKTFDFHIPKPSILKQFEESIQPIADLILSLQRKNNSLSEARDLLLPRLMSGEIEL